MKKANQFNTLDEEAPFIPPHLRSSEYIDDNVVRTNEERVSRFKDRLAKQPSIEDVKSFFTFDNVSTILTSLYFGADIQTALNVAGVPHQIYLQWKQIALEKPGLARNFFILEQIAKAQFEVTSLKQLGLMASIDTKATLFLLERTKDKYAPRNYIQLDNLSASYMTDLVGLISTGSMTVDDVIKEVASLTDEQITYLFGVQAKYNRESQEKKERKQKLLVRGVSNE